MKIYSTNYKNSFIEIAEDCPQKIGTIPPLLGNKKSIAYLQFEMIHKNPYQYTSDEILFKVFTIRKEIPDIDLKVEKQTFFSKGQPCFRTSTLTKKYGWGIHSNEESKIAIYGMETKEYQDYISDKSIKKIKAMRSKRKVL